MEMDARLIAQALNYHGQQLQKVWEGERNENELALLNLKEPSFEIYQQRKRTLSFSDRGKRLKLQQFIAKKADTLYDKSNLEKKHEPVKLIGDEEYYATMPGLDSFVSMEKSQQIRNFLESLVVGDVIFAQVMGKSAAGLLLKVLCNCSDCPRVVTDLGVKVLILNTATVPAVDKKGVTRGYLANDLVCVVVSEVNVESERVVAVMNVPPREGQMPHPPMGLIHIDDLPEAYKKAMDNKGQSYETIMENSTGFNNPNNIKYLADLMGLGQENYSNLVGLRERFPQNEYATELRQTQASKWAFRSVAEGIEHFKVGRHSEAFQCLNKALTIDPRNVEGLVARGALYANSCNFKKAINDFETALKLNHTHANARKYMAETLVALGRSYEDEKKYDEAQKAYEQCLTIAPYHEEARNSIEFIKTKIMNTSANTSSINPIEPFKSFTEAENPAETKKDKKKRKKERKSRSKKRQRWSSSSSSSSSGSSSSSSSDSSSSSSSGSSRSASRSPSSRKRKHKKDHRGSLSPLSKRMAQYNNPPAAAATAATSHETNPTVPYAAAKMDEHEMEVLKFLENTKDNSDYEGKVRKFLAEAERWKREKEKKHSGSEKTKKKKKKEKKMKEKEREKEEKKSRKKKKKEERKKRKKDKSEREFDPAKSSLSLSDLEQLDSKLNAYYAKVEKETAVLRRYVEYNDMTSPLSNAEKHADGSSRDVEFRRERDDMPKGYDRERRESMSAQRKDFYFPEIQRKPINDMFEHEHMIHQEMKVPTLDTTNLNAKWKLARQKWQEIPSEKKSTAMESDEEIEEKIQRAALEKSMSTRKQREMVEKRSSASLPSPLPPLPKDPPKTPVKYPTTSPNKFAYKESPGTAPQVTPSKFGGLGGKFQPIGQSQPPEPPANSRPSSSKSGQTKGHRSDSESGSERRPRKRSDGPRGGPKRGRRSRSRSRSVSSSGSSRSRSRSRSYSNRRSGSYERKYSRSPSGTYSRSRSRSRSRSYSRSRSRSRSGDRSGYNRRYRQFRPYNNNRGTYYKPRFQNYQNHRGGGNFQNRNRFYNNNPQHRFNNRRGGFQNNRGNHPNNRGRMQNNGNRGRFFRNNQGYRDYRDRRDFRDRRPVSRDRYSERSYSPDPMRKVDEAKEKINKMLEGENGQGDGPGNAPPPPSKRQDGPLSEGEERDEDDYERWAEPAPAETSTKEAA